VGGISSPGEVRGDVDALALQAVQSRPSISSHSIHREECVQSSWTSSNPLTTTVSDVGPHRPIQKEAFVGLCWGSCVFLKKSGVKLLNTNSGYSIDDPLLQSQEIVLSPLMVLEK
ncbi:hypothetical protein CHARACLAT_033566, partial [Characodon lateralis]|nr:hypothetical protein [Characodon lateralis]